MLRPLYPTALPLPPEWSGRPRGLPAADADLWRRFRDANLATLRVVYFNVHCGTVPGDTEQEDDATRRLRAALYAKRVDAVALTDRETWVIEIKPRLDARAIGQCATYPALIAARFPDWPPARPIALALSLDPDLADACHQFGIECYAPPFPRLTTRTP